MTNQDGLSVLLPSNRRPMAVTTAVRWYCPKYNFGTLGFSYP